MKWLKEIFKKQEEGNEYDYRGVEAKILDIRRRIDEQRAQLTHCETRSFHVERHESMVNPKPSVDQVREAKAAELDNIKAKLLGKKK